MEESHYCKGPGSPWMEKRGSVRSLASRRARVRPVTSGHWTPGIGDARCPLLVTVQRISSTVLRDTAHHPHVHLPDVRMNPSPPNLWWPSAKNPVSLLLCPTTTIVLLLCPTTNSCCCAPFSPLPSRNVFYLAPSEGSLLAVSRLYHDKETLIIRVQSGKAGKSWQEVLASLPPPSTWGEKNPNHKTKHKKKIQCNFTIPAQIGALVLPSSDSILKTASMNPLTTHTVLKAIWNRPSTTMFLWLKMKYR